MKKIGKFLMMMLCLSLLTGCGAASLSDKYDEEKLKSSVEEIIIDFNEGKYEDIVSMGSDELKKALTAEKLKEVWQGINGTLGQYEEISKVAFTEKDGKATVIAIAKYTENKVQFTISFNESMELIGIYIK